jgi:hypothetical protein
MINVPSPEHVVSASEVGAQKLGFPCRVLNPLKGVLCTDPVSGRPLLAINSCTPGSEGAAMLIDYEANEEFVLPLSPGGGGWSIIALDSERLLFESLSPLNLIPVNLRTKQVETDKIVSHDKNTYAWKFCEGPDGKVYFGSYPTCHAYRYDPVNGEIEDLGHIGPEGNLYVHSVGVTNDGWLLCKVMTEKPGIVACQLSTGEQHWIDVDTQNVWLHTVEGIIYAALDGRLQQFDSATIAFQDNTLPPAPNGLPWDSMNAGSTAERILVTTGETLWLLEPDKEPQPIWDLDLRSGSIIGIDRHNRVVGLRGQDYFVAEPLAKTITPRPITHNAAPVATHFLRADPDGGVTGGPTFGQTLFRFDPARNLSQNTGRVVDGGGEVYDGQWIDGEFYFVSYAGGELGVWNPGQPWDQWNGSNPRLLATYKNPANGSLIRPQGGMVVGPRGRLYAGWSSDYGTLGGGLTEYDIETEKSRTWTNERFEPEMSIGAVAADEYYVYGFTSNEFNGLVPPKREVVFWVFDPETEQVVFREAVTHTHPGLSVICVPATGHVWLAQPEGLRRFCPETLQFREELNWPEGPEKLWNFRHNDTRDNRIWFALGQHVVVLEDGAKPHLSLNFVAEQAIGKIAAGYDGHLYYLQGCELWAAPLDLTLTS